MTIDMRKALIASHQKNIRRYCGLLATELTDGERQYLHRRIAEEQAELEKLQRADTAAQVAPAFDEAASRVA